MRDYEPSKDQAIAFFHAYEQAKPLYPDLAAALQLAVNQSVDHVIRALHALQQVPDPAVSAAAERAEHSLDE